MRIHKVHYIITVSVSCLSIVGLVSYIILFNGQVQRRPSYVASDEVFQAGLAVKEAYVRRSRFWGDGAWDIELEQVYFDKISFLPEKDRIDFYLYILANTDMENCHAYIPFIFTENIIGHDWQVLHSTIDRLLDEGDLSEEERSRFEYWRIR